MGTAQNAYILTKGLHISGKGYLVYLNYILLLVHKITGVANGMEDQ